MEVILDTNFLITCIRQKIDIFSELDRILYNYEIVLPKQAVDELETLKFRKELSIKERDAASLALQIIKKRNIKILDLKGTADRAIVDYTLKNSDVIMASLDRGMKKHVKGKAKMLTIRGKNRLAPV